MNLSHHSSRDPSRLSRRRFLRLAGAAAASATLAACAPAAPSPIARRSNGGAKVQLVYQDWRTDWFPPMAQRMLDQFHATHPYVQADLDRAALDDWDPAQYHAFFTADGKQYGLPKYHGALALYYNKDLFDRYSVAYPDAAWDHDAYLAAMKRLTRARNGDGKTDLWGSMIDVGWERIQTHINAWGGRFADQANPARCLMGEPPALAALEWLRGRRARGRGRLGGRLRLTVGRL